MSTDVQPARLKTAILSHGLSLSPAFLDRYGLPFLEKRRAYGNPDPPHLRTRCIPQELYLLPSRLVVSVNVKIASPWVLDYSDSRYILRGPSGFIADVTFPTRPDFYSYTLRDGNKLAKFVTLYGGGSLGLFINGGCALPDMDMACEFCSIQPNRNQETEYAHVIKPHQVREAVATALSDGSAPISQVMLNGGNFRDLDKSFQYYSSVARAAEQAIRESGRSIDLHLIVFPPKNLQLIKDLQDCDVSIAMNTETFDHERFVRYCPGKEAVAGQQHILKALEVAANYLGGGRVFSIFVGGLEPIRSLAEGLRYVSERGVTPVVNVLHTDPETPLADYPNPSEEYIWAAGIALQDVYRAYNHRPFYEGCGRNSIDTEAYRGLFSS